ncbi:hypothetical protein CCC_01700 [Paramagnetospirillum magnetotacticum MS-1]|uniref:Flagellar protein FliL n=1 Tax=Paramagnetospirillum magnetotacticum MS-1 TaxID=272627 RepID=A0A0C2YAP8_PARME|nr:hypothetical protein [Paramagnetospirillum magnetotacticum]KIL96834.1 hypothetical protein CCC_01700 [Paramagnetospirillum magnetotacticum MS-1]
MINRRHVLGMIGVMGFAPSAVLAEEHKKEEKKKEKEGKSAPLPIPAKGERYVRIPTIALELWDAYGNFHLSTVDLLMLVPEEAKLSEKVISDKMRRVLNGIPYEEYMAGNPAPMIKATMLELVRKEPGCEQTKEVLISKMLFR